MQSQKFHDRVARTYRAPEIETDAQAGLTYNNWGALAMIHGMNVPFITRHAKDALDRDGFRLWSSPSLVLTLHQASDAHRTGDEARNADLMRAAIEYCNEILDASNQLPEDAMLRLTFAQFAIASVSLERNNRTGREMDIVKHGANTVIINAPLASRPQHQFIKTDNIITPTGTERTPRPPRDDYEDRQHGNHKHRDRSYDR